MIENLIAPTRKRLALGHAVTDQSCSGTITRAMPLRSGCPGTVERAFMVLGFIVLAAARLPNVALHGRVWAEEGTIFLQNAAVLPWRQALFNPVGGYLNLVANLAGIVGIHLVPLEQARFVGVVTGLLFQTLPAVLIVSSGLYWLQNRISILAALLLILSVPLAEEVWLNALHPQFHLTLCTALILAIPPSRGWRWWFHSPLILLAALCGPTTWFLFPLFVARAAIDRSRLRAGQAAVIGAGILLQVLFFFHARHTNIAPLNLSAVANVLFIKNVLIPTLDYPTVQAMLGGLMGFTAGGGVPFGLMAAEVALTCLIGLFLWQRGRDAPFWLSAAAIIIAVPSYAAARGGTLNAMPLGSGNRYAFVPQVLLALVLLWVAVVGRAWIAFVARIAVVWLLVVGSAEFHTDPMYQSFNEGPNWLDEVAAWRQDHAHRLRIWPDGWVIDFNATEPNGD